MEILGIDIGSTFIKWAVMDLEEGKISKVSQIKSTDNISTENGNYEVDLKEILKSVNSIIDKCLYDYQGNINGIIFSTQMHGFAITDETGKPVTNYISWQDERCLRKMAAKDISYLDHLSTFITKEELSNTGIDLKPSLALSNLYTMIEEGFEIRDSDHFCTLGSAIIFNLTGHNVCHLTNAAATGLADITRRIWKKDLLEKIKCKNLHMPTIVSNIDICGYYNYKDYQIPIYPDIGDQQASIFGSKVQDNHLNINIGTAGQISIITEKFTRNAGELRPYFGNRYLNTISGMPSGRNLDVIINFLRNIGSELFGKKVTNDFIWEKLLNKKLSKTGSLKVDTDFFNVKNVGSGSISRITKDNLVLENLLAATYDDFGEKYKHSYDKLVNQSKQIDKIIFSGGVAKKNGYLSKIISDFIGLKFEISTTSHEVFAGLLELIRTKKSMV
ncbi:sugar (pentulose or hexulose) kinase [Pullulanibacillus pueri]|uniref:Carbohydrate kinase FGGY N-terminal domain-containing protein n=1 Tax=Pullulanibacillus pueri TaxID=1437324 RepID=A0A8J3ELU7_9BACL|nr:FGGY family carbohydrate kinase [Pullulanibacillus pueri]MBM7682096.1 sugar (pentulose or hexulose) kinase [Pullulanibacillus pueri]GGH79997.1 hypothetical protein GCM10007096_15750 [Pullulanibacillus pueri]